MRSEPVGEIRRERVFAAPMVEISAETHDCADRKPDPVAIAVFIGSFSDVP
jgi:hypothetical protein